MVKASEHYLAAWLWSSLMSQKHICIKEQEILENLHTLLVNLK